MSDSIIESEEALLQRWSLQPEWHNANVQDVICWRRSISQKEQYRQMDRNPGLLVGYSVGYDISYATHGALNGRA